ncbi:MAG TPA: methionyl-tRNA formyltransferase [Candidatus Limiplasma sp.]|nr:methionyl-tRNA formyltransferase [Candidatus Limiplasma sp.]
MRIVFMGTPEFSVPPLQALLDSAHEVIGVFTQPDRPKGRGGKVQLSPVKALALAHGIPVFQPLKIRKDGLDDLRALKPDLCVTAAFGQILSQEVLDVPTLGTVNVHASLLPRHRGSAPVNWAILQGDAVTGITTMLTDKGIDTGDMLLRAETPIAPEDTACTLLARLSEMGASLLMKTVECLQRGDCPREKQDETQMTYDPKLEKEMGLLDFTQPTDVCLRRVRAMNPWPCAYAPLQNGVLKVWRTSRAEGLSGAEPGVVLQADAKRGLVIATGDGAMELTEIQAPNAKRLDARAFLLGHPIAAGKPLCEVEL